jgi:FMN phosphatase YigB (HAD superfamily)
VVVSNVLARAAEDDRQDFANYGFDGLVNAFVTWIETRVRRPDPRVFDVAMRTIERRAAEVVIVGNSEVNDIEPAVKLGMRSIRVAIEDPPPGRTCAKVLATSLFDVAHHLECWVVRPSPA